MTDTIIALRGKAGCGKTHCIGKFHNLMAQQNFPLIESTFSQEGKDFISLFKKGNLNIGVSSKGDTYDDVKGDLDWFVERGCSILICACRTSDRTNKDGEIRGSNTAIASFTEYEVTHLNKTISEDPEDLSENEQNNVSDAQRLLAELNRVISTD